MNRQEIKDIVYNKLKAIFIDENEIEVLLSKYPNDGEDLLLYNEIELDSLDILTFIIELEKEFNINIDDDIFNKDCKLKDIINYIYERKK
ncbi:hypothetical protein IKN40_01350 [bacterium]|nr:hypothetical protein [bacterium]